MSTNRVMKMHDLDQPRIRFNWGFHDATHGREMKWPDRRKLCGVVGEKHNQLPQGNTEQDKAYRYGYDFGMACDMSEGRPETSSDAWEAYRKIS